VTITLGLDGSGKVDVVAGGYADWERQRAAPKAEPRKSSAKTNAVPEQPKPRVKLSFKDQRDYDRLPGEIEKIEADIVRDEAALADPALYVADPGRFTALTKAIEAARATKDQAEERWLMLAEQVLTLKS
jgi:ABC transport system ATP-binding/permease protein